MDQIIIEEYRSLRDETSQRLSMLHNQLNTACVMLFALFLVISVFEVNSGDPFKWLLLTIFLPFICLGYNYQANQMTMEAVSRYIGEKINSQGVNFGWDSFFGKYKERVRLISFMKVFGLLLPTISIFIWIIFTWGEFTNSQRYLGGFDALLFIIGVVNYRYKFFRI